MSLSPDMTTLDWPATDLGVTAAAVGAAVMQVALNGLLVKRLIPPSAVRARRWLHTLGLITGIQSASCIIADKTTAWSAYTVMTLSEAAISCLSTYLLVEWAVRLWPAGVGLVRVHATMVVLGSSCLLLRQILTGLVITNTRFATLRAWAQAAHWAGVGCLAICLVANLVYLVHSVKATSVRVGLSWSYRAVPAVIVITMYTVLLYRVVPGTAPAVRSGCAVAGYALLNTGLIAYLWAFRRYMGPRRRAITSTAIGATTDVSASKQQCEHQAPASQPNCAKVCQPGPQLRNTDTPKL